MEPLPHAPATFRDLVEADLRRAARLIIKIQDEIDWQIRVATPDGDYHLAITMPDATDTRAAILRHLATFLLWKQAAAFCLVVETRQPDAVYAIGMARSERVHCLARIKRHPRPWTVKNFSAVEWLPASSIDPTIAELLPAGPRPMTPKEIAALQPWFGIEGKFPAVHVESRQVRGV